LFSLHCFYVYCGYEKRSISEVIKDFNNNIVLAKRILGVTIARKVLPHPQGIKGSMQNLFNKGLFTVYDPALPGRDARQDYFDVSK
jgi:hypothetical protein